MKRPRIWSKWSIPTRVSFVFAFSSIVISSGLSILSYTVLRGILITDAENSCVSQATSNAQVLINIPNSTPKSDYLSLLNLGSSSSAYLKNNGIWYSTSVDTSYLKLPSQIVNYSQTNVGEMIGEMNGSPTCIVAFKLSSSTLFIETTSLKTLDTELQVLVFYLLIATILATTFGTLLGNWASRLALKPFRSLVEAASQIAAGKLDTRIETKDQSEIGHLAQAFNDMASSLDARILKEARFAADVSHELKNPLNTLANASALLKSHGEEVPEKSKQAIELMTQEIERFQSLVLNLLELSKPESNTSDMVQEDTVLRDLVAHALSSRPEIQIIDENGASSLIISVDKRRMERVFTNIVQNADNYANGLKQVITRRKSTNIQICFDDDGPGIPVEERENVFERFHRGAQSGKRGNSQGTGLGLTIVYHQVRKHRGRIYIEASPLGGARVVVELPIAQIEAAH